MSKRLALELLQKVSNPSHMFTDLEADEDGAVPNVPQRIASRHTARPRPKSPIPQLDTDGKHKYIQVYILPFLQIRITYVLQTKLILMERYKEMQFLLLWMLPHLGISWIL